MPARSGKKGYELEEVLRAYFLRSGFFVIRSVPYMFDGDDLTDIDLWMYERPTGTTRRLQIVDIKAKSKPKAVERLFWTRGLAQVLGVDGAYVATTDKRASVRDVAKKLELTVIDGNDLQRIKGSDSVEIPERLVDEELIAAISEADKARKSKEFQTIRATLLRSVSEGFGRASLARSLNGFSNLAKSCVTARPGSDAALVSCRLAYLAAAIASESLDYISVEAPFRTSDERRDLLLNAVRYGALDHAGGQQQLRLAVELIRTYAPGPAATAVQNQMKADLDAIPAEIIADQAARMLKNGQLFAAGRELESAAYSRACPNFDQIPSISKSLLGAFLDYSQVRRDQFASAVPLSPDLGRSAAAEAGETVTAVTTEQGSLFKSS